MFRYQNKKVLVLFYFLTVVTELLIKSSYNKAIEQRNITLSRS